MAISSLEIKAIIGSLFRESKAKNKTFLDVLHSHIDKLNAENEGQTVIAFSSNNSSSTLSTSAHPSSEWIIALQKIEDAYSIALLALGSDAQIEALELKTKARFPRFTRLYTNYSNRSVFE